VGSPETSHGRPTDSIDRLVPSVLYYPVSPEKQTRFLSSTNERAPFHALPHATLPGEASVEARHTRAPLQVDAHYDAVILSEEAALFPLVRVFADEPPRSRRIPLQRRNLITSAVHPVTAALWRRAQMQPFAHFVRDNSSIINTSKKFSISCISLISHDFNSTRINTSGNKDLKSIRINTSGSRDLKSFRINTSKKQGRGEGAQPAPHERKSPATGAFAVMLSGAGNAEANKVALPSVAASSSAAPVPERLISRVSPRSSAPSAPLRYLSLWHLLVAYGRSRQRPKDVQCRS
jgi:hypothetical protein